MAVIVVSNTSPIVNLACVGRLGLLGDLYGELVIADAVFDEIVVQGAGRPGAVEVQQADWIVRRPLRDRARVDLLLADLDPGEAETIALAAEVNASVVLIDEKRGRTFAKRLQLRPVGLVGILLSAKHRGLIPEVRPVLDELIGSAGFWVSSELYREALQLADE